MSLFCILQKSVFDLKNVKKKCEKVTIFKIMPKSIVICVFRGKIGPLLQNKKEFGTLFIKSKDTSFFVIYYGQSLTQKCKTKI